MTKCGRECEVFSRIVGYFRPVKRWNDGKREEFYERVTFDQNSIFRLKSPNESRESR